jgi:GNAT superfamily N-acetyltransferase
MINIRQAQFPDDMSAVQAIFREYVASPSVSLEFQDYEAEFAALPGKYAAPRGRLLLAWQAGTVVGCAAFREVNAATCEMKRVYVRPAARGAQLGRRLVERLLEDAKAAGYACVWTCCRSSRRPSSCMRRWVLRQRRPLRSIRFLGRCSWRGRCRAWRRRMTNLMLRA